jgi:hypothetical protein
MVPCVLPSPAQFLLLKLDLFFPHTKERKKDPRNYSQTKNNNNRTGM